VTKRSPRPVRAVRVIYRVTPCAVVCRFNDDRVVKTVDVGKSIRLGVPWLGTLKPCLEMRGLVLFGYSQPIKGPKTGAHLFWTYDAATHQVTANDKMRNFERLFENRIFVTMLTLQYSSEYLYNIIAVSAVITSSPVMGP
jgi:hypothetical protein